MTEPVSSETGSRAVWQWQWQVTATQDKTGGSLCRAHTHGPAETSSLAGALSPSCRLCERGTAHLAFTVSPRRTLSDGSVISLLLMSSFKIMASRSLRSVTVQKTQNLVTPCTCKHNTRRDQSQRVAESLTVNVPRAITVPLRGAVLWADRRPRQWCTCDQLLRRSPSTVPSGKVV